MKLWDILILSDLFLSYSFSRPLNVRPSLCSRHFFSFEAMGMMGHLKFINISELFYNNIWDLSVHLGYIIFETLLLSVETCLKIDLLEIWVLNILHRPNWDLSLCLMTPFFVGIFLNWRFWIIAPCNPGGVTHITKWHACS